MGISNRCRIDAAEAPPKLATVGSRALHDLIDAGDELDRARRHAKWIRKSKDLHRATRAVEAAALAAHRAGVGWNEIGDVLGIERAISSRLPSCSSQEFGVDRLQDGLPVDAL